MIRMAVGIGAFLFLQNHQLVGERSAGSAAGTTPARDAAAPQSAMVETRAAECASTVLNTPPIVAQLPPARPPKETAPRPVLLRRRTAPTGRRSLGLLRNYNRRPRKRNCDRPPFPRYHRRRTRACPRQRLWHL